MGIRAGDEGRLRGAAIQVLEFLGFRWISRFSSIVTTLFTMILLGNCGPRSSLGVGFRPGLASAGFRLDSGLHSLGCGSDLA